MTRVVCTAVLAFAVVCSLAAQVPTGPAERPTPKASSLGKPDQYAVVLKGCIKDRRLTISDSDASKLPLHGLRATEFTLSGPKDLLQRIRDQHNAHDDEIAGVLSVPPERRPVVPSVDAKKLGPTSLGVGGRESIAVDQAPRVLTLKVESITHLSETCVEGREARNP